MSRDKFKRIDRDGQKRKDMVEIDHYKMIIRMLVKWGQFNTKMPRPVWEEAAEIYDAYHK